MLCDQCGDFGDKRVLESVVIGQSPLVACHRLDCGHAFHTTYLPLGCVSPCDCADDG
jgi:hypothetical protein